MVDESSGNVPPGILEMLKIFLAASSRGEQSVLILETKDRTLTTKYRRMEVMTGTPACASTSIIAANKKVNKARRSKLRLEQFMNKKMLEKNIVSGEQVGFPAAQNVGVASNQLIVSINQTETRPVETRLNSPIPQVGWFFSLQHKFLYLFCTTSVYEK